MEKRFAEFISGTKKVMVDLNQVVAFFEREGGGTILILFSGKEIALTKSYEEFTKILGVAGALRAGK